MKYYKISIMLIFFLIFSIGAISADSLDDDLSVGVGSVDDDLSVGVGSVDDDLSVGAGCVDDDLSVGADSLDDVQIDDSISAECNQDTDIIESQEENALCEDSSEELQEGLRNFTDLKNKLNTSDSNIDLDGNYTFDISTDSELAMGIELENRSFDLDGQNNVIDASNQSGVFIFRHCNVTIKNLIIKNALNALYICEGSNITTVNLVFENNRDSSSGAAVYIDDSYYKSFNDTFRNNKAKFGSSIYLTGSVATISNATFINDDEIEWALIYGDGDNSVINIMDCEFWNLSSKYATVVYNTYQTTIQRSKFINMNSTSAGAIAVKGFSAADGYVPLLRISDSQFINVSSSKNGGAILADMNGDDAFDSKYPYYGDLIINNTLFDNCRSLFGGAIAQFGGDLTINNTNFTNNNAEYIGGAIYASNASINVYNSAFANNTAVHDTFFETGSGSSRLANSFGKFNSGAIYSDTGNAWIEGNSFTKNTGALSLYNSRYYGILGNVFKDNGIAIKTYFDNDDTEIGTNTYNNDKNSLDNAAYDLNIDETGLEIPYDPIIISASADDSSFDLRSWGLVSDVDNQGSMGACWAFGTAGAIESAFLKATNRTLSLNISENNLKGTMLAYSILGIKTMTEGAAIHEPVAYLLSYLGIVDDTMDTFDELGKVSPIFLNKNAYHIQNVLMIPERNISNEAQCKEIDRQLKEALIKYGAITVYILGAQAEGKGYNKNTFSQYVGDPDAQGNHFVTLVGWDDNYSKDNFAQYEVRDPQTGAVIKTYNATKDGAWIIKNSWGTDFGDNGFYYVSYEDTTFATSYSIAYIINQTPLYDTVYQYDYDFSDYFPIDDNYTVYFLADKDEIISAVGTYFNGTGIDYTISVLVGYDDVLAYRQSGKSLYSGYQTIELAKQIAVKKGDQFAISIRTRLSPYLSSSKIVYAPGRSLVDDEDVIVKYGLIPCLKAYTFANPLSAKLNYVTSEKFTLTGPAGMTAIVEYDGSNTTLTFNSSGKAVLNKALKLGNHMANVYFNGKKVAFPIHVFKSVFIASSVTCAYNTHLVIDSYFQDLNDLALKNRYVTVKLDGDSFSIDTDGKGYIGITVDGIGIGSHTLTVVNPTTKESASCIIKVVSRFSGNKNIAMDYFDGTKYKVRAYGDNGKAVGAGQVVTFKLNKKTYRIKTDKNGWAYLAIPKTVVPKKYTVTASYKGQTVKNTITVKQILKSSNRKLSKRLKKWVLKATLKTSKKKGKIIKFKLNGKTYKAKTNSKGIAKVTIKKAVIKKLKKGKKYKVSISYLNDTIKKTITVKA